MKMLIIQCGNDGEADMLEYYVPNVIPRRSCLSVHDVRHASKTSVTLQFDKDDDVGNFSMFMTSIETK